jgi:hypothetical protein
MRRIAGFAIAAYVACMVALAFADAFGASERLANALFSLAIIVGVGGIYLFGWRGPGD